jgi:ligand-binding sensor domain-containing protein
MIRRRWWGLAALVVGAGVFSAGCRARKAGEDAPKIVPVDAPRLEPWALPWTEGPELPSNTVYAAARDPAGVLWFSTHFAVNSFDPRTRTSASHRFPEGDTIREHTLAIDAQGAIWQGTTGSGVLRLDPKTHTWTTHSTKNGLPGDEVDEVFVDAEGGIWCATQKSFYPSATGVARLDPKTGAWTSFLEGKDALPKWVSLIFQDAEGAMWFGAHGATRRDPATHELATYKAGFEEGAMLPGTLTAMLQDKQGMLWFGTYQGATRYDPKTHTFGPTYKASADGLLHEEIRAMAEDGDGALWFGTPKGVSRFDSRTGAWKHLTRKDGLGADSVKAMVKDAEGALWIGLQDGGVSRVDPKTLAVARHEARQDVADRWVTAIGVEAPGAIWFGTPAPAMAMRLDVATGAFTTYTSREGLESYGIQSIFQQRDGTLWIAGNRFDPQKGTFEMVVHDARATAEDASGKLWHMAVLDVARFDPKRKEVDLRYKPDDGLIGTFLEAMALDTKGGVWVGMEQGASRIDPKSKTVQGFAARDGLTDGWVKAIFVDAAGVIWFGTGKGVKRFDPKDRSWTSLDERLGTAGQLIDVISQDSTGALWFGSDKSLTRYDEPKGNAVRFSAEDGIDRISAVAEGPDKALWIGTMRGTKRMVLAGDEAGSLVAMRAQAPQMAIAGSTVALTRPSGLSLVEVAAGAPPQLHTLPATPSGADVTDLAPGPAGAFWTGTRLSGLLLRRVDKTLQATRQQGLPAMTITAVAPVPGSGGARVWVGTSAGPAIARIEGDALRAEPVRWNDMPTGTVDALAVAADGSAFVAYNALPARRFLDPAVAARRAQTRVFHVSDKGLVAEIPVGDLLGGREIRSLAQDGKGDVWAGTSEGLFKSAGGGAFAKVDGPVASLAIRSLIASPAAQMLWMAVDKQGEVPARVVGFRPENGSSITLDRSLGVPEGEAIDDMALDEAGSLIVLSGNQLARGRVYSVVTTAANP